MAALGVDVSVVLMSESDVEVGAGAEEGGRSEELYVEVVALLEPVTADVVHGESDVVLASSA